MALYLLAQAGASAGISLSGKRQLAGSRLHEVMFGEHHAAYTRSSGEQGKSHKMTCVPFYQMSPENDWLQKTESNELGSPSLSCRPDAALSQSLGTQTRSVSWRLSVAVVRDCCSACADHEPLSRSDNVYEGRGSFSVKSSTKECHWYGAVPVMPDGYQYGGSRQASCLLSCTLWRCSCRAPLLERGILAESCESFPVLRWPVRHLQASEVGTDAGFWWLRHCVPPQSVRTGA